MKISTKHDDAAVAAIAKRWDLKIDIQIADTRRARLFKVQSDDGQAVLKVYKRYRSSGENAAIPFLKDLLPGTGPQFHRHSFDRTVVLMEWLEGPTLDQLAAEGKEAEAIMHLGTVARGVQQTRFRMSWIYGRMSPKRQADLAIPKHVPADLKRCIDHVISLMGELSVTTPAERVVHGDLNLGNVILTNERPRLLDPKGLRADPAREYVKALHMNIAGESVARYVDFIERRAPLLASEADVSPRRLIDWAIVELAGRISSRAKDPSAVAAMLPYLASLVDHADRKA